MSTASARATLRYAVLDFATIIPTVVLWTVALHAAEPVTAVGLWLIRVVISAVLWATATKSARRWEQVGEGLDDQALLDIDADVAAGSRPFMRNFVVLHLLTMISGTVVALLRTPRAVELGGTELVCALCFAAAVAAVVMAMEFWLWEPFDALRSALGKALQSRKLVAQRPQGKMVRAQLILGAGTTVGIFVGCFAMGWLAHVNGLRSTQQAELRLQVSLAAHGQELEAQAEGPAVPTMVVVQEDELPPQLLATEESVTRPVLGATLVALDGTEVVAAARRDDGRWLLAREPVEELLGPFVVVVLVIGGFLSMPLIGTTLAHFNSMREQLLGLGRLTRQVVERGDVRSIERLVSLRSDEIDALVRDFNAMIDMFDELGQAAAQIAEGDLRVELQGPGELYDAFRTMVNQLHDVVGQIRGTAVELATAAAEIQAITQEQSAAAMQQADTMRVVRSTVASLASAAEVISKTADGVRADAEQSRDTTHGMIARIGELSSHAAGVRELLGRISEIADRSDLLALNGSLEAVRAGEAGRGFSLVAAEMRRLAERVGATVDDVRARVAEIDASGVGAVAVAEASRARAEQTAVAAAHISQVIGAQSQETDVAAQHVHYVTEAAGSMSEAIAQTQATAEGLKYQADALEQLTRRFSLRE
ncbi:MAG: methyl-accepting chemotaxis protein [Myxococcales bacterium]|nr:methyl-accepting chemotaxis protein [Myxococcales bacterium]